MVLFYPLNAVRPPGLEPMLPSSIPMKNVAAKATKAYGGKYWILKAKVDGASLGDLVWCVRVDTKGKSRHKREVPVVRVNDEEVTIDEPLTEALGVPRLEVWRQHVARRQWSIDGRRVYIIDFDEGPKLYSLSETDDKLPRRVRDIQKLKMLTTDLATYARVDDELAQHRHELPSWTTRGIHARITGPDPVTWHDQSEREAAWGDEWFIYGVGYNELTACERDDATCRPLSHDEAGALWEGGWSRVQFDV